jgi:hypothetical protein
MFWDLYGYIWALAEVESSTKNTVLSLTQNDGPILEHYYFLNTIISCSLVKSFSER